MRETIATGRTVRFEFERLLVANDNCPRIFTLSANLTPTNDMSPLLDTDIDVTENCPAGRIVVAVLVAVSNLSIPLVAPSVDVPSMARPPAYE